MEGGERRRLKKGGEEMYQLYRIKTFLWKEKPSKKKKKRGRSGIKRRFPIPDLLMAGRGNRGGGKGRREGMVKRRGQMKE